jgi:flagellin-like hook-associated protein FlgL
METSMARLSSGNRINSASDDAAGVAIASRLTAEIRGTGQAIRNALNGQALLDTAEGAHKEIENILQRMREVSVQAGNDTNNQQDRDNLQAELNALSAEIDRIAGTTTWAGTGFLNGDGTGGPGTATDFSFQVGANTSQADRISVQIGAMSTEALGFGATAAVPQIGGDPQAVTIAAGIQTTTTGNVISIDTVIPSGFAINGVSADDMSGSSVSGAGDINGDGLKDLIVGNAGGWNPFGSRNSSATVVFGKTDDTAVEISTIATETTDDGFVINNVSAGDLTGFSVSGAGDVNGDGLEDLIIGAPATKVGVKFNGASYVVFGKANGTAIDLAAIASNSDSGGFVIKGAPSAMGGGDLSGMSVSGAGDVNGDGLADLIIGAPNDDPHGSTSGASFVVFGKTDGGSVELSSLQSSSDNGGFVINGVTAGDNSGWSVSGAGDVNNDGYADVIVGAIYDDPNGTSSGASHVVFGKPDGTAVELSAIEDNSNAGGFVINGVSTEDYSGRVVSGAGDVNGDGYADLIIGAYYDDPNGSKSGASHVVFGKADGTAIELSDVEANSNTGGFVINGVSTDDESGYSVSGAGDVNGDGYADVIVGAVNDDPNGTNSGSSTVVFGKTDGIAVELSAINDTSNAGGFVINGASANDYSGISVSGAGDVNGDGYADVIVGTQYADPNGSMSGASHVIFGKADGKVVELSDVAARSGTEAALANNASFVVNGKTLTLDLSAHHDGSNNNYYTAAEAIAAAINGDSDLQTLGYSAAAATLTQVNAGKYAAGDIIISRADTQPPQPLLWLETL